MLSLRRIYTVHMPADTLPASGDRPETAKTCDARGMAEIHRMFRAGFAESPGLVANVAEGDRNHADLVADHLSLLSTALHAHHEGEDAELWPKLRDRAPACALHVTRMQEQHAEMLIWLERLDETLPTWRASAARTDAGPVIDALAGINAALAERLPDEESNIVPVMEHVITPKEVAWFSKHGRRATPKGQTWNSLGAILTSQPDGGEAFQREHLPPPVRLLWRLVGRRKYERMRSALEGHSAAT